MNKVGIVGASGRMGQRVRRVLESQLDRVEIIPFDQGDSLAFNDLDVVIDFSLPAATEAVCNAAGKALTPLVTGVTGRDESQQARLVAVSKKCPVFAASNFSVGVHVLSHLVQKAAQMLDTTYHLEIVESHHQDKQDLPSGTALSLAQSAARGRAEDWDDVYRDRGLSKVRRTPNEIGVTGYRGGAVIGDHHVHFLGPKERIELSHSASDRDLFADGAVQAAIWLCDRNPGLYGMDDLIA